MSKFNIQIYVVSHSAEDIQKIRSDDLYTPLFVGRNGKDNLGYCSDDSGDNISYKNSDLSELTGLYWMWKNSDADIIGLCHYRRYFKNEKGKLLNQNDIKNYLRNYDILMAKKTYLIKNSLNETYKGTYYIKVFKETRKAIEKLHPECLNTYDNVMGQNSFSCYNMFVTSKEIMSNYCNWLFPIIEELEINIDLEEEKRIIGVITEYLFNVWVTYQNLNVKELPLYYLGNMLKFRMYLSNNKLFRRLYLKISKNSNVEEKIHNLFYAKKKYY